MSLVYGSKSDLNIHGVSYVYVVKLHFQRLCGEFHLS